MCALQTQRSAGRVPAERGRPRPRGEGQVASPRRGAGHVPLPGSSPEQQDRALWGGRGHPQTSALCDADTGEQGPRGREGHDADPVSWVLLPPHGALRAGCGEQAGAPTCILASGTSLPARRPAWCTGSEWVYAWDPQFRRRKLRVPGPGRPVVDVRRAPSCNRRRGAGLADPLAPCPPSVPGPRPQSCSGRGPVPDRCPGGGPGTGRSPGAAPTAPLFPAGLGSIPTTSCPSWRLCSSAAGTCTPGSGPVARRGTCCHSRRPGVSVPALPKRETSQPQRDPWLAPTAQGAAPAPDP